MPTASEFEAFKMYFKARHPEFHDVYCVADGMKLLFGKSDNVVIQNRFYSGWTHDHYVSNVFVLAPRGHVIACALSAPGCLQDSTVRTTDTSTRICETSTIAQAGAVSLTLRSAGHFTLSLSNQGRIR